MEFPEVHASVTVCIIFIKNLHNDSLLPTHQAWSCCLSSSAGVHVIQVLLN